MLTVAPVQTLAGGEPEVGATDALAIGVSGSSAANGENTFVIGNDVTASEQRTFAAGYNTTAQRQNQVVIGTYSSGASAKPETNARGDMAVVIGQGNEEYGPDFGGYANILIGDRNSVGTSGQGAAAGWNTVVGHYNTVEAGLFQTVAIGAEHTIAGSNGFAIGYSATAGADEFVVGFDGNVMKVDSNGNLTLSGSLTENGDPSTTP